MVSLNNNVFSLVVMAQIKAKSSKTKDELKAWKLHLVRLMYERGHDKATILAFFRVIDWMMRLPEGLEREFLQEIYRMEEDKKMPYITSAERFGIEKGMVMGVEKGMELGVEKGMEKGMYKEKLQTIMSLRELNMKMEDIAKATRLTPEKVRAVLEAGDKGLDLLISGDEKSQ